MADGIVILPSYYDALKTLPDADRLEMYDALMEYGLHGKAVCLPPHLQGFFSLIKPNIDSSQRRYRAAKENGSKGGAPPGNQNARKNNRKTTRKQPDIQPKNNQDKDIDSDSDMDSDNDYEKEKVVHTTEKQPVPLAENIRRQKEMTFEEKREAALASLRNYQNG